MKKIVPIAMLVMAALLGQKAQAQVDNIPYYTNLHFNNSFFVIAESNENSNFYAVNLDQFSSDLERSYFEDIAYKAGKIIRVDAGNAHVAWFRAKKVYTDAEVSQLLLSLKQQAITHVDGMTELQKQEWQMQNNKQ